MDAIAYDGNGDKKARVHARPSAANSSAIADTVFAVLDRYDIDIDLLLTTPGLTYSDHASFWSAHYGAVLIIEEFDADGNPHYHTQTDLTMYFDVPYFEKMAKLSIGSLATLAVPFDPAAVVAPVSEAHGSLLSLMPNPTSSDATLLIRVLQQGRYSVSLENMLGQTVRTINAGVLNKGTAQFSLPSADLPPATYMVRVADERGVFSTQRLVRVE
jgi:hypothetical protein